MLKRITSLPILFLSLTLSLSSGFSQFFPLSASAWRSASKTSVAAQSSPQVAALIINEYLADPADDITGDANGDGTRSASQDEFVELINIGSAPLNVGGFTISDAAQVRFTFPAGKIIPAGEAAVVFGGGTPTGSFGNAMANGLVFAVGGSGLSLNNGADSIIVKDNLGMEVARRDYPSADGSANQSITRSPDISGAFVRHSLATGSGGALFSPGLRVNGTTFSDAPHITHISPEEILQSASPFELTVQGDNFDASAIVQIDFNPVPTNFVSSTELTATVSASIASAGGSHRVEVVNSDGNHSNAATLTVILPPPVLFSLTPRAVEIGIGSFTLILRGDHFGAASKVLIENTLVTTFFSSSRELVATVPTTFANSLGTRRVRIRNSDLQVSNELSFEVIARTPRITALNPSQVIVGSPAFALAIAGANFTSDSTALWNQQPLATKFLSSSSLIADVPASAVTEIGLKSVVVQNNAGAISNEAAFRVVAVAPLIGSVAPDSALEGSAAQTLVISGERFKQDAIVRAFKDSQFAVRLDTTFISSESLEAKLPASLLQTADNFLLRVENPDFGFSNEVVFKVFIKDPLVINEYLADPPDGIAGDANGDGSRSSSQDEFIEIVNRTGSPVDISGYKLSDAEAVRHIFAAATIIPPFEAVVVFGGGTAQGKFGNAMENGLVFKASTGGLSLNNGGDTLKLEDAMGRTIQEIKFGAAEGNASQSINRDPDVDGAIFTTHQRATGTDKLFSPGAKATGEAFTIKPSIQALSPASVHARSGNFSLTISGANFKPGAVVVFAGKILPTIYHSDDEIEATVSAELLIEGRTLDVQVQNPRGETSRTLKFLIFDDPPQINSINPKKTGTGAENFAITVEGERFQRDASVLIANEKIATRFVQNAGAAASLVAIAPEKFFTVARNLEIRVINADANVSNVLTLAVENGPLITRLSRSKIKVGKGSVEISFSGVAFSSDILLFVDDKPVQTTFINDSSFTARIPAEMTNILGELTLQARHADGGRSNKIKIKVVE